MSDRWMCVGVVRNSRKQQRSGRSCEHRTASPSMRLDVCRNNQPQRPSHPIRSRRRPPRFDRPPAAPPPPRDVIRHEETNERLEPEPHICPSIHIHAVHALELSEHSTDEWISSSELQDRRASDNVEKKKKKKDIKIAARRTARSPTTPSCVETPPANRGASSPPSCICPGHLFCHHALRFPRNCRTSSRTYVHLSTGSDGNLSTLFPVTAAVEYLTESGTRREKTTVARSDLLFRRSD